MNRKPVNVKVREKILASLPNLPDSDLAHIASLCDGLLKLRAQQKQSALQPRLTIREAVDDALRTGSGNVLMPPRKDSREPD